MHYPLDRDLYGGERYPPFEQLGTARHATEPQICPTVIMTRTRMEINTQWLRHLYVIVLSKNEGGLELPLAKKKVSNDIEIHQDEYIKRKAH